ncbi:MAG: chemotaxis protein CheD [Desulfurivibrionaceae bacterium]|jgi:chemotaxis protein CheD|nr:chemotaxis protein CheD [Pseudomonadota bacterium]MCG2824905.1 chemotaxis protein CheD [Desulfobulbaceae bacterium]MDP2003274.1 chemotaxis protein CheD [Desulfurivibrionaceae bacterium]PKN21171.1 MAG: chemotaxis protein CheD [Deltaproteobacteria bacterium HGW-Deltaproteobacteria-3]MBU4229505.1 chemotaxis protein CheD [Pseudomonadota bacterium]
MPQIRDILDTDLPVVNLHPGELFVAQEPTLITTILGSCVSVCLFCPSQKTGAMCHGVMPVRADLDVEDSFRFVESSVRYMVEILTHGDVLCPNAGLVAKIFGGADVLDFRFGPATDARSIGAMNIKAAREALARYNVSIAVEEVGGVHGCKLFFYTHTGEVLLRRIPRSSVPG